MNGASIMDFTDERFIDINHFPTPQISVAGKPADNGVLYLSVAAILGFKIENYEEKIRSCYLKKGLVARWPGNDFDQAAWDDYLGIAVASIHLKQTAIPREILGYAFKNLFIFNTDKKLESKDWFGRHVPVWVLMFAAAFPKLKYLLFPFIHLVAHFFNPPNMKDTSGFQLQWIFLVGASKLGADVSLDLSLHQSYLKEALGIYYAKEHPFNLVCSDKDFVNEIEARRTL